jgi:hypothetical protein
MSGQSLAVVVLLSHVSTAMVQVRLRRITGPPSALHNRIILRDSVPMLAYQESLGCYSNGRVMHQPSSALRRSSYHEHIYRYRSLGFTLSCRLEATNAYGSKSGGHGSFLSWDSVS